MIRGHELQSIGRVVRWFPGVAPGPPDLDGRFTSHRLLALGHWSDEAEVGPPRPAWVEPPSSTCMLRCAPPLHAAPPVRMLAAVPCCTPCRTPMRRVAACAQGNLVSFADVRVSTRNGHLVSSQLSMLGTWEHAGAVTDIQVRRG